MKNTEVTVGQPMGDVKRLRDLLVDHGVSINPTTPARPDLKAAGEVDVKSLRL